MDILLWEDLPVDAKEAGSQGLKPEEEIEKFTVDEHVSEVERVNLFLTGGHAVQERKAIESLPALLKSKGRIGWDAVQSNLLQLLLKLDIEAQISVAEALATAMEQRALPPADVADCLLPLAILHTKNKEKTEEEAEAWLQLLLLLLPVLAPAQLLEVVLPLAQSKGQVNESVACRVSCCRILGGMAQHLAPADVCTRFLSQMLAACQDTDYQVRIAAADQLPVLARVLSSTATVSQLLLELTELLADDEVQVRVAALSGLVALCALLPQEQRRSQLLPLVRKHMQPLELALPLQRALASLFPELLSAVCGDLEASDAGLLYGCFRHLAARSDSELRRTCAQQLPALMSRPLPGSSPSYLHDTWTDLAMDHDTQVRAAIAAKFHLVARDVAAVDAARLLRKPLVALLKDITPAVREALLPALAETFQVLSGVDEMYKEGLASEVHQALLVALSSLGNSWRCQQHIAAVLPALPGLLSGDVLADHWTPYSFGLLLNGAAAVKPAAATGLACLLRGCRKERPRSELYCRIIRELAWGRSCWARLAYIQLCTSALPLFSCRWFKEHFLEGVLELLTDAVPNVRLAALGLLPALKQTIRLPEDVEQLEQLNNAMSSLMTDNDRDVSHAARAVHDTFKRTPLRMTGGGGLMDMNGSASGAVEFEAADRAKEEAEQELSISQEELEKLRIEWCTTGSERKGRRLGGAGDAASSSTSSSGSSITPAMQPLLRRNNSRGKGDAGLASSTSSSSNSSPAYGGSNSSSSNSMSQRLAAAPAGGSFSGRMHVTPSTSAGMSWSPDANSRGVFDRRFTSSSNNCSSSSSSNSNSSSINSSGNCCSNTAGVGLTLRTGREQAAGGPGNSAPGRPSAGRSVNTAGSSSSSSSFNSVSSPRQLTGGGSSSSSSSITPKGGPGAAPAAATLAFSSPTGSHPLANLRLPVLAGSPKMAGGGAGGGSKFGGDLGGIGSSPTSTSNSTGSSSSNGNGVASPSSFLGASRLGLGHSSVALGALGSLGSSGLGSPVAAAAAAAAGGVSSSLMRPMPGSLAAAAAAAAAGGSSGGGSGRGSGDGGKGSGGGSRAGAGPVSTSPTKSSAAAGGAGGGVGAFVNNSAAAALSGKSGSSGLMVSGASRLLGMQGTTGVSGSNSSGSSTAAGASRRFR